MKGLFISKFFNKDYSDLVLQDVQLFFSIEQSETSMLEFKSGEVELEGIYKEICAFLNTEGGLLIVGAPKEKKIVEKKIQRRICIGEMTSSAFISKEWLYQKLYSNIVPSPTELTIHEMNYLEGKIFLIDIPQSSTPPHQSTSDGCYYIRVDCEAKPAPHGLVQALFDKRRKPKLFVEFGRDPMNYGSDKLRDRVNVHLKNDSPIPAEKSSFHIKVINIKSVSGTSEYRKNNDNVFGEVFETTINVEQVLPSIISIPHTLKVEHKNKEYIIFVSYWCLQADYNASYAIINPTTNIIKVYDWQNENHNIENEAKRILKS